jgi:cytochrome c peroxidase
MKFYQHILFYTFILLATISCRKNQDIPKPTYNPTPYNLNLPSNFPQMVIPSDNPLTEQGVELGRHIFWDNRLSGDNSMACASCHLPQFGFSDPNQFSTGIQGLQGQKALYGASEFRLGAKFLLGWKIANFGRAGANPSFGSNRNARNLDRLHRQNQR